MMDPALFTVLIAMALMIFICLIIITNLCEDVRKLKKRATDADVAEYRPDKDTGDPVFKFTGEK